MIAIIGKGIEWSMLPITRELGKQGQNSVIIAFQDNVARFSKHNKGYYRIPNNLDSNFIKFIRHICKINDVYGIICVHEDLKSFLISNQSYIRNLKFITPNKNFFDIANNKKKAFKFVKSLGLPIPKVYKINNYNDLENIVI